MDWSLFQRAMRNNILQKLLGLIRGRLGYRQEERPEPTAEGGLKRLIGEGRQAGLISEAEEKMLEGILSLKEKAVREVMIPRTEMRAVECEFPLEEAINLMMREGHSRIPTYRGSIDNMVGIIYAKDLLKYWGRDLKITQVMRTPYFVPERKNVLELLQEFKRRQTSIAIVVDEYGGTSGLVTLGDLMREVIGEVREEYCRTEEELITQIQPGVYMVDARLKVEELEEHLEMKVFSEEEEFHTVGGLVFHATGRIPQVGEVVEYRGLKITIESANERRIWRVRVEKTGE